MTARTFIIGDVHGMSDELSRLVRDLKPVDGDRFLFLGDLVDKGPDSLGALRQVRDLIASYAGSLSICGNHEESALRLKAKADKAGTWAGIAKAEKEKWLTDATADDFAFMSTLALYARPFGDRGSLMVHGGLFPAYYDKYPGLPELSPEWHKGGGRQMDRARRLLRVRHVHRETGEMVSLGDEGEQTRPWVDWYDGREGLVFYGHEPQRSGSILASRHAIGVDTGAVFGGYLTAVVLTEAPTATKVCLDVVAVKASQSYAQWLETSEE